MARSLYLDTARLGPMSPTALRLHTEFVRLAAEEPCSLYCEEFLKHGIRPGLDFGERYPELQLWHGISDLKQKISDEFTAGAVPSSQVLLTSRTGQLMRMSADMLTHRCQRILVTDLIWPPYLRVLRNAAATKACKVTLISIRERMFNGDLSQRKLLDLLVNRFEQCKCDGLFLPLVDHCGARLPVEPLYDLLHRSEQLRCSVLDASQSFGHINLPESTARADFVFGGGHKWVGSYLPLGIGLVGNAETAAELRKPDRHGSWNDALLRLLESSSASSMKDPRETVNMTPLLACRGALEDVRRRSCDQQNLNRRIAEQLLIQHGWRTLLPDSSFQTGILLAQAGSAADKTADPAAIRRRFMQAGLAVTTYAGGLVRFSIPYRKFTTVEVDCLGRGLAAVSSNLYSIIGSDNPTTRTQH